MGFIKKAVMFLFVATAAVYLACLAGQHLYPNSSTVKNVNGEVKFPKFCKETTKLVHNTTGKGLIVTGKALITVGEIIVEKNIPLKSSKSS